MTGRDDPTKSRGATDSKLRLERDRADEEVLERSTSLGETADEVIERARARARLVLDLAREREDAALDVADAGAAERSAVDDARATADAVTAAEYAAADAALFDERSRRRRAVIQLLALEREETDRVLASERQLADHMVEVRDDMLGVVSHDLRSHLNGMLARTSLVLLGTLRPRDVAHEMQALQYSIAQMDKLLSDLLDVASMESGRMRVDRAPVDLCELVARELEVHRPAADAHSIRLELELPRSPVVVDVDQPRMARVLMNLLANAIKFTPQGGRIEVAVERLGSEARIRVKDSGPGIAADQLEAVFERFRRLDSRSRGYGLGLYISRSIVDAHHGRIWAESTVGAGSTFCVALPAPDA